MNVQEFLTSKSVTVTDQVSVLKVLKGKKVRVIGNGAGHNLPMNSIFTVDMANCGGTNHTGTFYRLDAKSSYSVMLTDIEMCNLTKEDMQASKKYLDEKISEMQKEKLLLDSQIAFMQDNNLEEYDEDLFKVNEVLKKLDDVTLTGIERAKVIASIIKG